MSMSLTIDWIRNEKNEGEKKTLSRFEIETTSVSLACMARIQVRISHEP